jgi:anti-sigma factor RsiW
MTMTCRELDDFLADYVAKALPREVESEFERHLAVCPPCVDYLSTYRETVRLGKAAYEKSEETIAEDVPERLVQAILAARERRRV